MGLAVDTGVAVNIMFEEAEKALKWNSCSGPYTLRPHDTNLSCVIRSHFIILDIVSLELMLSKNTPLFKAYLYVTSGFIFPSFPSIVRAMNPALSRDRLLFIILLSPVLWVPLSSNECS